MYVGGSELAGSGGCNGGASSLWKLAKRVWLLILEGGWKAYQGIGLLGPRLVMLICNGMHWSLGIIRLFLKPSHLSESLI